MIRPHRHRPLRRTVACVAAAAPLLLAAPAAAQPSAEVRVQRGLERLVAAPGGPPGAIATLHRDGRTTVLRAGRADVRRARAPRIGDHMRIASVSKAYSGAVALRLVQDGRLRLDEAVGDRLPTVPAAWAPVTLRQLLNHTSGLPDYTRSRAFARHVADDPRGYVSPARVLSWVRDEGLDFAPGSRYAYSNTDNIVVALMAEAAAGRSYGRLLRELVLRPGRLRRTTLPTRRIALPRPFLRGYEVAPGARPQDVTTLLSPSGAWASGGIVSTPREQGAFVRRLLGGAFFGAAQAREQRRFVRGASSPPGPGANAAGLALFRYRTRCGVVYGHTGTFPGFTQWIAATADGRRSVTTTITSSAPRGRLLRRLRAVQATAVCALLGREPVARVPMLAP